MGDVMLQKILVYTFTKADFYRDIDALQEALERSFFSGDGRGDAREVHAYLSAKQDPSASRVEKWGDAVISAFNRENLYERISDLKVKVEELPALVLYVPVLLEENEIESIGGWFRESVDQNGILEVIIDADALGGCMFAWRGVFYDFSLNHFLEVKQNDIRALINAHNTHNGQ